MAKIITSRSGNSLRTLISVCAGETHESTMQVYLCKNRDLKIINYRVPKGGFFLLKCFRHILKSELTILRDLFYAFLNVYILYLLRFKSLYQVSLKMTRNGWPSNDKLRCKCGVVRMSFWLTNFIAELRFTFSMNSTAIWSVWRSPQFSIKMLFSIGNQKC